MPTVDVSDIWNSAGVVPAEHVPRLRLVSACELEESIERRARRSVLERDIGIADANEKSLARLGDFISKSVSSTSQALGTGSGSRALTF